MRLAKSGSIIDYRVVVRLVQLLMQKWEIQKKPIIIYLISVIVDIFEINNIDFKNDIIIFDKIVMLLLRIFLHRST